MAHRLCIYKDRLEVYLSLNLPCNSQQHHETLFFWEDANFLMSLLSLEQNKVISSTLLSCGALKTNLFDVTEKNWILCLFILFLIYSSLVYFIWGCETIISQLKWGWNTSLNLQERILWNLISLMFITHCAILAVLLVFLLATLWTCIEKTWVQHQISCMQPMQKATTQSLECATSACTSHVCQSRIQSTEGVVQYTCITWHAHFCSQEKPAIFRFQLGKNFLGSEPI